MIWRRLILAVLVTVIAVNATNIHNTYFDETSALLYPLCSKDGLWGYIDDNGNWQIEPQWYYADIFQGKGYAKVTLTDDEYTDGIIDVSGNYIVQPQYAVFNNDRGQYYGGIDDGIMWVYDANGKAALFNVKNGYLSDYIFSFETNPWVTNSDLVLTINDNGDDYRNAGYINRYDGKNVIPYLYYGDYCSQFVNGYAVVGWYNEALSTVEMKLIDENGNILHLPDDVSIASDAIVNDNLVAIQDMNTGLFGYYDVAEKRVSIACQFRKIGNYQSGYASASIDGELWGHIDRNGHWVVKPKFPANRSYEFIYERALVQVSNEQLIINPAGDIIARIPLDATGIVLDNSYVFVYVEEYGEKLFPCALINDIGSFVIPFEKGYLFDLSACYDKIVFYNDLQALVYNHQYGFINSIGMVIIDFQFDYAKNYYNNLAYVECGDSALYLNLEKQIISYQ